MQAAAEHLALAGEHAEQDDRVLDLFAEELRLAHESLSGITGKFTSDDLLGEIFLVFVLGSDAAPQEHQLISPDMFQRKD